VIFGGHRGLLAERFAVGSEGGGGAVGDDRPRGGALAEIKSVMATKGGYRPCRWEGDGFLELLAIGLTTVGRFGEGEAQGSQRASSRWRNVC